MLNGLNQRTKLYYLAINGSSGITKASNKVDSSVYKDFNFFCTFCFTVFFLFPSPLSEVGFPLNVQ